MDIEDTLVMMNVYAKSPQNRTREENKQTVTTNQKESTPDAASENDPSVVKFHQQKITEEEKSAPHTEDEAMDTEDTPVMTHIYAKSPQTEKKRKQSINSHK